MAQSGQYNYSRCMKRGGGSCSKISSGEFIVNAISIVYLLNKTYKPYDKWSFRGMENLVRVSSVRKLIEELALLEINVDLWNDKRRIDTLIC